MHVFYLTFLGPLSTLRTLGPLSTLRTHDHCELQILLVRDNATKFLKILLVHTFPYHKWDSLGQSHKQLDDPLASKHHQYPH